MFNWNDPTIPFNTTPRTNNIISSADDFVVYQYDNGKVMIETSDQYALQDLKLLSTINRSHDQVISLIQSNQIEYTQDTYSVPDGASEATIESIQKAFNRTNGNLAMVFDLELFKDSWAELYFHGLQNDNAGDGLVSMYIAIFIRDHYNLSIDTDGEMGFYEYVAVLHSITNSDDLDVSIHRGDLVYAGEMDRIICDNNWPIGDTIHIEVDTLTMFGGNIKVDSSWVEIQERSFEPIKLIDATVRPLTDQVKTDLRNRSQQIVDRVSDTGTSYLHFTGEASIPFAFGVYPEYVDGRVVVDPVSLYTIDTRKYYSMLKSLGFTTENPVNVTKAFNKSVEDDDLHKLFPYSIGYIFSTKHWGLMDLSTSQNIEFRKDSIDKLVMDEDRKQMLLALSEYGTTTNSDIIDNKGGGMITLLHGAPGLGKTLAAEVIAEHLERPLYKVSVGELGTTPDQLEQRLQQILNIATRWGAILLIDEADVFLEARTSNDIQRNAMVAVFLRLLEYYEGTMFLTTNRVSSFDEAFFSRIVLAINFQDLEEEARKKVWNNLLSNNNIVLPDSEISNLSKFDKINARQIKNIINGARALALSQNQEVKMSHIAQLLTNTVLFLSNVTK